MTWRPLPRSPLERRLATTVFAAGDRVVVWGGVSADGPPRRHADGAAFDVASATWEPLPQSPMAPREACWAVDLGKGQFLFFGGRFPPSQRVSGADAAVLDTRRWGWRSLPPCPFGGRRVEGAIVANGRAYFWGGWDAHGSPGVRDNQWQALVGFDLETDEWFAWDAGPMKGRSERATAVGTQLIVWGGVDETTSTRCNDGARFDTGVRQWQPLPPSPLEARSYLITCASEDELYLVGGDGGPARRSLLRDGAAYRPAEDSWRVIAPAPVPVGAESGYWYTAWCGGQVVLSGPSGTLLYDPSVDQWSRSDERYGIAGPVAVAHGRVYGHTAGAQVWGDVDLVVWEPDASADGGGSAPAREGSVTLADDLLPRLSASTGAMRFELRAVGDIEAARRALEDARRRILAIPHPEEPEASFASWVGEVETRDDDTLSFVADLADAEAYRGIVEAAIDAVVAALAEGGVIVGHLTAGS